MMENGWEQEPPDVSLGSPALLYRVFLSLTQRKRLFIILWRDSNRILRISCLDS